MNLLPPEIKEKERKSLIYYKIARQLWAIVLLIAELELGQKPDWNAFKNN